MLLVEGAEEWAGEGDFLLLLLLKMGVTNL